MESLQSYWHLGDELRGQSKVTEDHKWLMAASKLAEHTRSKGERRNNLDLSKGSAEIRPKDTVGFQEDNRFENLNFNMLNLDMKIAESMTKSSLRSGIYNNMNAVYQKTIGNNMGIMTGSKYNGNNHNKEPNNNNNYSNENAMSCAVDKRFKTLPAAETLPRNEVLGGYIFVCNNDTMQEDLKRQLFVNGQDSNVRTFKNLTVVLMDRLNQLSEPVVKKLKFNMLPLALEQPFCLPPRYRDSVRAITPGLPLFLYNYTTHQLHGIFEATTFGGSNIDPTAWEDKKCKGESRFPAQVRIRVRKLCKALEEDAFRPVLHHYDGPKFRLELSVPEVWQRSVLVDVQGYTSLTADLKTNCALTLLELQTLDLLDLCEQAGV
ncbi:hypothetical protein RJ639_030035 [Escallonia herrerae]|uniref:DCD domain-containing protein n=1 Tax=Escallonia herrerae TaxID=1293975 RepID=A0AA89BLY2_9ASTE|nr:hypothetical protein RJ639_030035 [Escallonia herrerae]